MKTSILTTVACLLMLVNFAQSTFPNLYYIGEVNGKTVVMLDNKIIPGTIQIDTSIQLLANGIVVWGNKTSTILRPGDCIDDSGIVYSERKETDFIGNPRALNHIHMLPEVTISGAAKADNSELGNYKNYMEKLYKNIELNDYYITLIKEKLWTKTRKEATKYRRKINSLERENMELKIDFDIFMHYGVFEDWPLFRVEKNEDLKLLVQDIAALKSELL